MSTQPAPTVAATPTVAAVRMVAAARIVFAKELRLEWRSRARAGALGFFSLATLLLFSFAVGPDTTLLAKNAPGYLWLAVFFASVLALGESFRVEHENRALEALRLLPVDPRAIFIAKALANAALLFALAVALVPFIVAVYGVDLAAIGSLESAALGAAVLGLGSAAVSAPGTLFAAMASQARARDVLLPLLLFPLLVPALLAAVKATALVVHGDPMGHLSAWLGLLVAFNLVYWGLGFALFVWVIEE